MIINRYLKIHDFPIDIPFKIWLLEYHEIATSFHWLPDDYYLPLSLFATINN